MMDNMSRLQVGFHRGVYDGAPEMDAYYGSTNRLEPDSSQSDRTPAPRV